MMIHYSSTHLECFAPAEFSKKKTIGTQCTYDSENNLTQFIGAS